MPWNDQSGGNRGNGGGPWGSGPGGNRNNGRGPQQPPDLEELLRRSADRFRGGFPGGTLAPLLLILVLVFGWLLTGLYKVEAGEVGVVLRFGKFSNTTAPGLHYHLPWPIEQAVKADTQKQRTISIGGIESESQMLTGDENIVDLQFNVQWRIGLAPDYLFNVAYPETVIKTTAESVMREVVGRNTLTFVTQDGREQVQDHVRTEMTKVLTSYNSGIFIDQVKLVRVDPHKSVVEAYRDVQAARADRERMRNEAEAHANKVIPAAEGRAARTIAEAEAYKIEAVRGAEGEAQRFLFVYDEYKKSPQVTRERMFLETMEQILRDNNKVILDGNGGAVPYLPLNELNKKSGQ